MTKESTTPPTTTPTIDSTAVSRSTTPTMVNFEAPIDLRMPISRVRSKTDVYIDWKMTRKPIMTAMPTTTRIAVFSAGNAIRRQQRIPLIHGHHLVVLEAGAWRGPRW